MIEQQPMLKGYKFYTSNYTNPQEASYNLLATISPRLAKNAGVYGETKRRKTDNYASSTTMKTHAPHTAHTQEKNLAFVVKQQQEQRVKETTHRDTARYTKKRVRTLFFYATHLFSRLIYTHIAVFFSAFFFLSHIHLAVQLSSAEALSVQRSYASVEERPVADIYIFYFAAPLRNDVCFIAVVTCVVGVGVRVSVGYVFLHSISSLRRPRGSVNSKCGKYVQGTLSHQTERAVPFSAGELVMRTRARYIQTYGCLKQSFGFL